MVPTEVKCLDAFKERTVRLGQEKTGPVEELREPQKAIEKEQGKEAR